MIRPRTISFFFLSLAGIGLYSLGYWQGQRVAQPPAGAPAAVVQADPGADAELLLVREDPAADFDALAASGAWFQLERWLVDHRRSLDYSHGARLIKQLSRQINKYDAVAMRRVLRAYLAAVPDDAGALFLLSDLQQVGGMREAALETLFTILDFPVDGQIADNARRSVEQIVKVIDNELQSRGALAEREAFWRHVSQRLPSSDYFRYEWARSLAAIKQWDEAQRVLAETGTSDVAQETLDTLSARIEVAKQGLQFQRDGDRLLSSVATGSGLSLTLLVDTGANVTSLSKTALRAAAAVKMAESARVRTAGGVVETGVYRVPELTVQGRRFTDVRVIELPVELPELDGLLGLDLLNQLGMDPLSLHAS